MEAHVALRAMVARAEFRTTEVRARVMAAHGLATAEAVGPRAAEAAITVVAAAGIRAEAEEVTPAVVVADIPVAVVIPAEVTTKQVAVNEVKDRGEKGRAERHAFSLCSSIHPHDLTRGLTAPYGLA
jgi:hypothetical protein